MQLVDVFRARVVDVSPESLIIEITGTEDKIDGLVEMLKPYGVLEMARTGRVAMSRGNNVPVLEAVDQHAAAGEAELDSGVSFSV
jgi:acetolactate synthase-1/3 small subunit